MKFMFTVSARPHPQSSHFASRIFNFATLKVYTDDTILVEMRPGSKDTQVEVLKEIVGSYCGSRNVKVLKVEEVTCECKEYLCVSSLNICSVGRF